MDIEELIAISKKSSITDKAIKEFYKRAKERDKLFKKELDSMRPDSDWLNKRYDI